MECNKDEAVRAKQIAESKMQSADFVGALKFAMKAKRLFPDVENIAQILTVCEVHNAAQNKLSGSDMDWYGILQTERLADEATIKKQYRKLALLLHPDKNKSAGAEAAFKLIGEANRVLSDQAKRSLYDIKCMRTAAPTPTSHHSNGSSLATKHDQNVRNYQTNSFSHSNSWNSHQHGEQQTFWTSCQHCHTRYQYYKTIVNATLRCQQCSKTFTACDLGYQGVPPGYTWTSFNIQNEAPKPGPPKGASESNGGKPCGRGHEDKLARSNPVSMTKCTAGVAGNCKGENSKDGYVAGGWAKAGVGTAKPPASKAKESQTSRNVGSKKERQPAPDSRESCEAGNGKDMKNANVQENGIDPSGLNAGVHPRRSSRKRQHVSYMETAQDGDCEISSESPQQNESFNSTKVEKREVPANGGLFNNNNPAGFAAGVGDQNREVGDKAIDPLEEKLVRKKRKIEQSHAQREEASKSYLDDRKSKADNCSPLNSNAPPSPEVLACPDPDFCDFEKDKAENCFAASQFWAIYDNTDSMPRFYALVRRVFTPFKLQITWLEPDPDEQGEIDWHNADFPVACGKFKLGDSQKTTDLAMFSHQMHCIKGNGKGSYLVYPTKGETWAIFRDWYIGWSSNPEKHSDYEFEYVEVLSDFDENVGIEVAYLAKVKGFVSLFQRTVQNGTSLFCVPPNALYRFSHQIPSYKMTGDEREGVPRGSFELDPAGLPSNLFEVGDVKMEDRMLNNGVNSSCHESSKHKVEQVISNESIHRTKLHESNDAERVSSILRRSPRSNRKSSDNGQVDIGQYMVREDGDNIGCRDYSEPGGTAAACQSDQRVKTPKKHVKNDYELETSKVRRSPRRDLSKKNAQVDAGEGTAAKVTDNHSNANKKVKDSSFSLFVGGVPPSSTKTCRVLGASRYDFKKEKSVERFQCNQIWAIYSDRDKMPEIYAQIKKIEFTPNFRLHVSLLEPCSPPKGLKRPIACGTFKVKNAKMQSLSCSAFSHQLKVEPMSNNRYEIYPSKGEIWALYKDQNYELTSSSRGKGECHIVEVLADSNQTIQVAVLMPLRDSQPFFKVPRIQRSKTGIIEILRADVGRFSHQIPAFQHSGEDDVHLRGCWELDPSAIPGFVIQLD